MLFNLESSYEKNLKLYCKHLFIMLY